MRKKLLSILALLCLTVTSARADWTGDTYTATADEDLEAITVDDDATLTINEGVTVTVTGGINVASGTLTIVGPGTLVVTGAKGNDVGEEPEGEGGAAISGNIIVQGGATVTATGGTGGTGGEGNNGGTGGTGGAAISGNIIVQDGATVTATGGNGGTGGTGTRRYGGTGGNGGNAFAGTLTYKSGTVTANGGSGGSGGTGKINGSSGSAGKAFANDVDFTQTTGYSVTDGTSTIGSVLDQIKVVISGGIPIYNVTANQVDGVYWSTFYSNEGNYQASEGTQVFAVTLTGTAIEMTVIPNRIALSGKGVVLKNTTTGSITMTKTETAPDVDYSGSSLTGTMTSITNPGNAYVLNGKNGAGFYKLKTTGTIGANKAYLTYSDPTLAREFFLFDEATGIEMPTVEDVNADAVVYDLQGRRVVNPTKGLYIVNGKKVFINK